MTFYFVLQGKKVEEVVFGSKVTATEDAAIAKPATEGKPAPSPDSGRSGGSSGGVAVGRVRVRSLCLLKLV